ncbi:hypothetical protein [Streptomyces sp. NPDC048277]|uniref:hypothetical protein n=1 Tax=Streptomyces sp. NPDC048277 TaxID=3155027 RepID=UPI0033DC88C8
MNPRASRTAEACRTAGASRADAGPAAIGTPYVTGAAPHVDDGDRLARKEAG